MPNLWGASPVGRDSGDLCTRHGWSAEYSEGGCLRLVRFDGGTEWSGRPRVNQRSRLDREREKLVGARRSVERCGTGGRVSRRKRRGVSRHLQGDVGSLRAAAVSGSRIKVAVEDVGYAEKGESRFPDGW